MQEKFLFEGEFEQGNFKQGVLEVEGCTYKGSFAKYVAEQPLANQPSAIVCTAMCIITSVLN